MKSFCENYIFTSLIEQPTCYKNPDSPTSFENQLSLHTPKMKMYAGGNQMPFMTQQFSEEIMKRSRLRRNFRGNSTKKNRILYNRQRNYCVSLLRKSKREYYENVSVKDPTDNKMFWKIVKP